MNIVLFIYSLQSGGAERVTAHLANHWAARGWRVTVVTLTAKTDDFYRLHPSVSRIGLDVASTSRHPLSAVMGNIRRILALRRTLRLVQPDVALAMMSTSNILLALASVGLRDVVSVGSERIHPPRIPLGRLWEFIRSVAYGRLDAVVALTSESAHWIRQNTRARKVPVVPNPAYWPLPVLEPSKPPPSRLVGRHILLAVGRLDRQKGFDLLLQAFTQLAFDFPSWQLVILGEGPERQALEAQVRTSNLSARISLPGRVGNVGQWYEAADLCVMSSRFEGFPNTLVEAMAHGLPAISFDCETGPRDIIRHEVDGLLVPMENIGSLETALRRLMADSDLRARWGSLALDARERFSMARVATMWDQLFEELRSGH